MSNIILLIYAAISSLGLVFIKLGGKTGAPVSIINHSLHFNLGFYAIFGILLYGISFIIYTYLVSKNDLGYIVPVSTALVYIFVFAASFLIFKETFTAIKVAAILLIIFGVILLNLNK
jgi:drug/metabolite transporter (DMT)-like permease